MKAYIIVNGKTKRNVKVFLNEELANNCIKIFNENSAINYTMEVFDVGEITPQSILENLGLSSNEITEIKTLIEDKINGKNYSGILKAVKKVSEYTTNFRMAALLVREFTLKEYKVEILKNI